MITASQPQADCMTFFSSRTVIAGSGFADWITFLSAAVSEAERPPAHLRRYLFGPWIDNDFGDFVLFIAPDLVHLWSLVQGDPVRDDVARIDLAFLNSLKQGLHVCMHVGLPHLHGDPFAKGSTKRDLVEQAAIHARYRDGAPFTDRLNRLTQDTRAIGLEHQCDLDCIV